MLITYPQIQNNLILKKGLKVGIDSFKCGNDISGRKMDLSPILTTFNPSDKTKFELDVMQGRESAIR